MSKVFKCIFSLAIVLIVISQCIPSFAAVDMNLNSNTTNTTSNTTTTNSSYSTAVTTSGFDLQLTNILSICLIVVGVLLILLGIAILIRLRS